MKMQFLTLGVIAVILITAAGMVFASQTPPGPDSCPAANRGWKGYNYKARIFVGTGQQWCDQSYPTWTGCYDFLGPTLCDKVTMKWNAQWDNCNANGNNDPAACQGAWTDNEWNGNTPGGSGAVWHYKIVWHGSCGADYTPLPDGGYCIWGSYEVLMDQGKDSTGYYAFCNPTETGHQFCAHAIPNGYGA